VPFLIGIVPHRLFDLIRKFFFWLVIAVCSKLPQIAANYTVAVVVYGPMRFAAVYSNPCEAYIFYGSLQQPA